MDHVITGVPWAFRFWLCAHRHCSSKDATVVSVGAVSRFCNIGFVPSVFGVVAPVSGLTPAAGVFPVKNNGHHFIETNNDRVLVF